MPYTSKEVMGIFPPHPEPTRESKVAIPRPSRLREYYPSPEHQAWFDEWERKNPGGQEPGTGGNILALQDIDGNPTLCYHKYVIVLSILFGAPNGVLTAHELVVASRLKYPGIKWGKGGKTVSRTDGNFIHGIGQYLPDQKKSVLRVLWNNRDLFQCVPDTLALGMIASQGTSSPEEIKWSITPRAIDYTINQLHDRGQLEVLLPLLARADSLRLLSHVVHDQEPPHDTTMTQTHGHLPTNNAAQPQDVIRTEYLFSTAHLPTPIPLSSNPPPQTAAQYALQATAARLAERQPDWEITIPSPSMITIECLASTGLLDIWKTFDQPQERCLTRGWRELSSPHPNQNVFPPRRGQPSLTEAPRVGETAYTIGVRGIKASPSNEDA
ncbi:hypothetical protein BU17DRAFT_66265 [Hysterangium stoloniferum]|nr:hypothetical protein BU17DRAFT_66265 [Hysterangium stoloniferum]